MTLALDLAHLRPVSWFPGHMLKAQRELQKKLSLLDVVVVVVDARAPASSYNSELTDAISGRPKVLVLNKADLADPKATQAWVRQWRRDGEIAVSLSANRAVDRGKFLPLLQRADKRGRRERGATRPRLHPLRAAVVGVPNVGKSSLINGLVRKNLAQTGAKPGVTRHQQWAKVAADCELLDTPGIMVPRVATLETGLRLGLTAAIRDEVAGRDNLAAYLLHHLSVAGQLGVLETLGLEVDLATATIDGLLVELAGRWGLLKPGGGVDRSRAANRLVQEFRAGRLGRMTLDPSPQPVSAARSGRPSDCPKGD